MKLLGHAWVAINAKPDGNRPLLILGSVLPEIRYYTTNQPFAHDQIHEGGDIIYKFLQNTQPSLNDFGIGMMAHSTKFGADKFNFDENLALLGYEGHQIHALRTKLVTVLCITHETAKTRAHNIMELALELNIIKSNPAFIKEFNLALSDPNIVTQSKTVLSDCFKKPYEEVSRVVDELLGKAKPQYFQSAEGLAGLWRELSQNFDPEFNIQKLAELLEELTSGYQGRDEIFLSEAIKWTEGNLQTQSPYKERRN